jgi:hypothetical protein
MPEQIVPEQDIKPLMDEIDRLLAESGGVPPGAPPAPGGAPPMAPGEPLPQETIMAEEFMETGAPEGIPEDALAEAPAEAVDDVAAMAELLGVEEAQAQALYDASQQLGQLEGKSPSEVAQMMLDDFQLRMQVEKIAGGMADMEVEETTEIIEEPVEPVEPIE